MKNDKQAYAIIKHIESTTSTASLTLVGLGCIFKDLITRIKNDQTIMSYGFRSVQKYE